MSTPRPEGQDSPYFRIMNTNATPSSADLMALEDAHGAHNYQCFQSTTERNPFPFPSCSTVG